MAIEERSLAWRIGQSWYVLLTLPLGLTSWMAFLYLGIRAKSVRWLLWAGFYLAAMIVLFTEPEVPGPDGEPTLPEWASLAYVGMWFMSIGHALWVRRAFLRILDARDGGTPEYVAREADDDAAAQYNPRAAAEPAADFDLFTQPSPEPVVAGPPPLPSTPPPLPQTDPAMPPPLPQTDRTMPPPLPQTAPAPTSATPPPLPPSVGAPRSNTPPPFSGPAPFGGVRDADEDRPQPPAPPPPPRRPDRDQDR
jgi:hypothetical protein